MEVQTEPEYSIGYRRRLLNVRNRAVLLTVTQKEVIQSWRHIQPSFDRDLVKFYFRISHDSINLSPDLVQFLSRFNIDLTLNSIFFF